jgi:hypothetical protein
MTPKTIRLIAVASREGSKNPGPGLATGFSFDDAHYEIAADGTVDVPERAAPSLCQYGAFVVAPTQPDDGQSADVTPAAVASLGDPIE